MPSIVRHPQSLRADRSWTGPNTAQTPVHPTSAVTVPRAAPDGELAAPVQAREARIGDFASPHRQTPPGANPRPAKFHQPVVVAVRKTGVSLDVVD